MNTLLASVRWIHGAPDCSRNTDPLLQVHMHSPATFILRENKCFNYEANFMYLLIGERRAVLFDTGAGPERGGGVALPLRKSVDRILTDWSDQRDRDEPELVVAHTHSHGDHVFWDSQFADRPRTHIVGGDLQDVIAYYGLPDWPEDRATLSLGGRDLTVFPLPGHHPSHIAIYDPLDKLLLTGDTLYPGLLTVQNWQAFRRSTGRLADFVSAHPVDLVLGNHVEMQKTPRMLYPIGSMYQPEEHGLPLGPEHVLALHRACEAMAGDPHYDVHDEFIIGAGPGGR